MGANGDWWIPFQGVGNAENVSNFMTSLWFSTQRVTCFEIATKLGVILGHIADLSVVETETFQG